MRLKCFVCGRTTDETTIFRKAGSDDAKDMRCELHLQNDLPEEFLIRVAVAELEKNAPTLH